MQTGINVVIGVIGSDCHAVGNKIIEMTLIAAGFKVSNLGVMVSREEFVNAAVETNAQAILVSSLYGHGEIDCRGLREHCIEAGIGEIILYAGGNLVVGKRDFAEVDRIYRDMGYNRVFAPGSDIEEAIVLLKNDITSHTGKHENALSAM